MCAPSTRASWWPPRPRDGGRVRRAAAWRGEEGLVERHYRVAIAGCHRMLDRAPAGHNWAAGFAAVPRAEIVAVFDRSAEARRAFVACWGPLPTFADYGASLADARPDVVCVATRQTMHAEQIEQAV